MLLGFVGPNCIFPITPLRFSNKYLSFVTVIVEHIKRFVAFPDLGNRSTHFLYLLLISTLHVCSSQTGLCKPPTHLDLTNFPIYIPFVEHRFVDLLNSVFVTGVIDSQ